jgi:hypothetical protein
LDATLSDFDAMVAFVNARLEEEELDALAARQGGGDGQWTARIFDGVRASTWQVDGKGCGLVCDVGDPIEHRAGSYAAHIARQNPAATLARVAALRALVALHEETDWNGVGPLCDVCKVATGIGDDHEGEWPCATLRHLAAIWRIGPDGKQHPDWREEWAA